MNILHTFLRRLCSTKLEFMAESDVVWIQSLFAEESKVYVSTNGREDQRHSQKNFSDSFKSDLKTLPCSIHGFLGCFESAFKN